jgi:small subunit ribosomal protein S1
VSPEDPKKEDSFAAMFEREAAGKQPARRRSYRIGDRLDAIVVRIGKDSVFVELDGKQQAFLEAAELRDAEGNVTVKEGDRLSAHVVEVDDRKGFIRLGRTLGKPGNLAGLETAKASGLGVEGKVTGVNKGGLDVDFGGTRAFCPVSQIDTRRVEDPSQFVGQVLRFAVTDIRDGGKNVVVSRRALLEKEQGESAARAMDKLAVGAIVRGTVTGIRDFGAFVDLGGVEGLVPRSEIAHDKSVDVASALSAGDTVEVQVREIKDAEPGKPKRITLSLKALTADPWAELNITVGRVIRGTVTRLADFGAFVRLAPGVEGLLHVSELGKDKPAEGTEMLVVVKKIDREAKKISLVPAPDNAQEGATIAGSTIAVGSIVNGTVERIETYGLFVQVEGTKGRAGRGLVPNAEIGVPRGTDLRKQFPEGTKVTAKVLETGEGRLRLSIKGAKADEERADYEEARAKQSVPAKLGTFADLLKNRKL